MKNVSREYATMDEDERRRYAMEPGAESGDRPHELEFPPTGPRLIEQKPDHEQREGGGVQGRDPADHGRSDHGR